MKTLNIKLLAIIFLIFLSNLNAQNWKWLRQAGDNNPDEGEIVAVDYQHNVIITGKFQDTAWFGSTFIVSSGGNDIYLAKYDSSGVLQWVKKAGGTGTDEGLSVQADYQGNIVVTGFFQGAASFGTIIVSGQNNDEVFVAKYSPTGTLDWVRTGVGKSSDRGKSVDTDSKGNVLVTGSFKDTTVFGTIQVIGPVDENIFLAKYNPAGTLLWLSTAGGPKQAWTSGVSVDNQDNIYIEGSFKDTAVFGTHSIISYGGNDFLLAKADTAGNWLWAVHGGGKLDDYGNGMEVDVYNNIAITGSFFDTITFQPAPYVVSNGNKDGFVAYYNSAGNCLWLRNLGGPNSDKGINISTDQLGNVYVTGFVNGIAKFNSIIDTCVGGDDIFIAKYNQQGAIQYAKLAGGTGNDSGKGIKTDGQGVAYITGPFNSTCYFENQSLVSMGANDIFLAKFSENLPLLSAQPQSQVVCVGDTVTLTVQPTGTGPFNFLWFDNAGSILGAVNNSYSFVCTDTTFSGKYYCHIGNSNGSITSDTAFITVHPLPVIQFNIPDSTLFISDTNIYIAIAPGYSSYLWSTGDTNYFISYNKFIPGFPLWQYSNLYVTVTNEFNCMNTDSVFICVIIGGISENELSNQFNIFPNPATNYFSIKSEGIKMENIEIRDISGRLINLYQSDNQLNIKISTNGFTKGVYFVRIRTEKGIATKKLIVQ